ncbi:TcpQ domain-containing protein [Pseudoalteromonas distincta]|uniref:TcpQ domain-containing protein n=1 Tax=Pseudoalteromonas distincta TaxID=77608 RepID=UPI0032E093F6
MLSWIKHIVIGITLILCALYFILNSDSIVNFKESTNAAANGLSRFYKSIRSKINEDKERDKYVLDLDKPEQSLDRILSARGRKVEPMSVNWGGKVKARRFERGFTLREVLTDYAKKEDIELYWYLNKDYVIKDHFRVDGDFITTLYKVSRSINNDFVNEVHTFFCYKQRAAIITELPSEYVRSNCVRLTV